MDERENKSEVARLMRQIELEYEAAQRSLYAMRRVLANTSLSRLVWKIWEGATKN